MESHEVKVKHEPSNNIAVQSLNIINFDNP